MFCESRWAIFESPTGRSHKIDAKRACREIHQGAPLPWISTRVNRGSRPYGRVEAAMRQAVEATPQVFEKSIAGRGAVFRIHL